MIWRCRGREYDFAGGPLVMGIVNLTPDSFSDGGRHLAPAAALERVEELVAEGADLVDLGAESTRPGSESVPAEEQLRRLEPVLEALPRSRSWALSVDTASAAVAEQALAAGAEVVNDVTALGDPSMAGVVAERQAGLVLMHLQGEPRTMQQEPRYQDVAREVREHLAARLAAARQAGIAEEAVALDPGIGFGKTAHHNLELIARLGELAALGRPLLVGISRKSFLGRTLALPPERRLEAGIAAAAVAVFQGAAIVRTHDVLATRRGLQLAFELRAARRPGD